MLYRFVPYLWVSIILTIILIWLTEFAWKRRSQKGVPYFLLSIILAILWIVAQAFEIAAVDLSTKIVWANIVYIPASLIPVSYFLMSLNFVRQEKLLKLRWLPIFLIIMPIIHQILTWTNGYHGLIRQNVHLVTSGSLTVIGKSYGPFFKIYTIYNYLLTLITMFILVKGFRSKRRLQKAQSLALFMGLLLPTYSVLIFITKLVPYKVDPTPVMIGISGIIISWGIFRYHLFDIVSIAHTSIIKEMSTGMIILDNDGEVLEANPAACNMLDLTAKQHTLASVETVLEAYPELIDMYTKKAKKVCELHTGEPDHRNYYEVTLKQLTNSKKVSIGWIMQFYDITQRKLKEKKIKEMATHDELTGLVNRACFEKKFIKAKERAEKAGTILAVGYLDLDDFKKVNDSFGHEAGDVFLMGIAERLRTVLKGNDIGSRFGGDEFVILFSEIESKSELRIITENISKAFEKCIEYDGIELPIKFSIGYGIYPQDGDSLDILMKKADSEMYEMKRTKKMAPELTTGSEPVAQNKN